MMIYVLAGDGYLESADLSRYAKSPEELLVFFYEKMADCGYHVEGVIVDKDNEQIKYNWGFSKEEAREWPLKGSEVYLSIPHLLKED